MKICKKCSKEIDEEDILKDRRRCKECFLNERKEQYYNLKEKFPDGRLCVKCGRSHFDFRKNLCWKCRKKKKCTNCNSLICKRSEICLSCRNSIESNPNFKNAKVKHSKGYVLRYCPNHPRTKDRKTKYIGEHILVMGNYLGRDILEPETVHHKNGLKWDNRIENLELWTSHHHSGQRVSDLIDFANEIISKYGNDSSKFRT